MAFDPSVIGSIGDTQADVPGALAKAATLRDMTNRSQLNELQLHSAKEEAGEQAKVKDILKGSDYTTPQGLAKTAAQVNRVSPRAAMDLLKQGQQYQSGQIQQQLDQYTLAEKRQDMIVNTLDGVIAEARSLKNAGGSDLDVNALITQRMPQAIQQLRSQKLPDGAPALPDDQLKMVSSQPFTLATLESWEAKSKQGQQQIKQRLEQFKADTQGKSEKEKERHDEALEANAAKNTGLRAEKMQRDEHGNLTPEAIDLAAQRIANGEKPQDVLANFGRGKQGGQDIAAVQNRFAQIAHEEGMTADEIALRQQEMRGSARAELALGEREGKIAPRVQEAKTFAQIALKASENVPRGDWKQMNQVSQWLQDAQSGKELGKFQAANVSLINAYSAAVGGGQIHQHDQEVGAHLLSTANGPENYKAKVEQLIVETEAALKAPEQVKEQWRQTREQDAEGRQPRRPGQTGAPTPAQAAGHELKPGSTYQHPSGATVEIIG